MGFSFKKVIRLSTAWRFWRFVSPFQSAFGLCFFNKVATPVLKGLENAMATSKRGGGFHF